MAIEEILGKTIDSFNLFSVNSTCGIDYQSIKRVSFRGMMTEHFPESVWLKIFFSIPFGMNTNWLDLSYLNSNSGLTSKVFEAMPKQITTLEISTRAERKIGKTHKTYAYNAFPSGIESMPNLKTLIIYYPRYIAKDEEQFQKFLDDLKMYSHLTPNLSEIYFVTKRNFHSYNYVTKAESAEIRRQILLYLDPGKLSKCSFYEEDNDMNVSHIASYKHITYEPIQVLRCLQQSLVIETNSCLYSPNNCNPTQLTIAYDNAKDISEFAGISGNLITSRPTDVELSMESVDTLRSFRRSSLLMNKLDYKRSNQEDHKSLAYGPGAMIIYKPNGT